MESRETKILFVAESLTTSHSPSLCRGVSAASTAWLWVSPAGRGDSSYSSCQAVTSWLPPWSLPAARADPVGVCHPAWLFWQ